MILCPGPLMQKVVTKGCSVSLAEKGVKCKLQPTEETLSLAHMLQGDIPPLLIPFVAPHSCSPPRQPSYECPQSCFSTHQQRGGKSRAELLMFSSQPPTARLSPAKPGSETLLLLVLEASEPWAQPKPSLVKAFGAEGAETQWALEKLEQRVLVFNSVESRSEFAMTAESIR